MDIKIIQPTRALNGAFRKIKPSRAEIEVFKVNLIELLDRRNNLESEEFHKNLVSDFLKKTYYDPGYFINTKGRNDLVIHTGDEASSAVGVILEVKRPTNKAEMMTKEQINVKALHELILYYLRERVTLNNLEIKFLIATNINEWFVFDAPLFERLFVKDKNFVRMFSKFESGQLAGTNTDFFYDQIAAPFVAGITDEIEFTHFDIRHYENPLRNNNPRDDNKLIALFKLLSPEHLLKLPFANDSNSLDKGFYTELLHILGLTEIKSGGKKLIQRHKEADRNTGSLLESTIIQLDSLDKIRHLASPGQFGENYQERLFNVALELCITWINRILFLKLLEAQLLSYHKRDKAFEFLNLDLIKNYDDLNTLFFQVLACKLSERNADVKDVFRNVPYLNSSLFEATPIEHATILLSNLRDGKEIPILASTVLRDRNGKRKTGRLSTLQYFFEFLNAYDFSSEGSEEIQEENKALISASVLGLIFEKINGYKDGSFFTPGCITMYMCHASLSQAVVDKFNMVKGWGCSGLGELYDKIEDRAEANQIINSLKICDPAVGSGHFLVSALNEIISIKGELKILQDRDGWRLKEYEIEVVNDELIITDDAGDLFEYNPLSKESQRVQEALFHEKQVIIENCLFGVDINPNSVKICRLRLWIELLKNSYYKNEIELETLPNIDINIKCGNSLISRFELDADLSKALAKSKWSINSYRRSVQMYRNAKTKDEKREMELLIDKIKSDFRSEIAWNDPKIRRLKKLSGELFELIHQPLLFEKSQKEKESWDRKVKKITEEKKKLETQIEEIKNNKVFEDAFEWRFEFPEVLDNDGVFRGFDAVIGNPPYVQIQKLPEQIKKYLEREGYKTFSRLADLYCLFYERSINILRAGGVLSLITSNKFFRAGYGKELRKLLNEKNDLISIVDFGELPVFDAGTDPCIIQLCKRAASANKITAVAVKDISGVNDVQSAIIKLGFDLDRNNLDVHGWTLCNSQVMALLQKIRSAGTPLGEYVGGRFYRGILTGFNEAFVIDQNTRDLLIAKDQKSAEVIKPWLRGKDIRRWFADYQNLYVINIQSSSNENWPWSDKGDDAESVFCSTYPAISAYLHSNKERLVARDDQGRYYWELRSCVYNSEFDEAKIVFNETSKELHAFLDTESLCINKTGFIIISENAKYLLGILNSKLMDYFYRSEFPSWGDPWKGGRVQFRGDRMAKISIPSRSTTSQSEIEQRVETILNLKQADPAADVSELEAAINQIVYKLYDLTPEEIAIVEDAS